MLSRAIIAFSCSLQISVRDGKYDGLDVVDPVVSWQDSASAGDVDLAYGASASTRATTNLASLPRNVWGSASTNVAGWGIKGKANVDAQDNNLNTDLTLDANNDNLDLSMRLTASAGGGSMSVDGIQATKGLDVPGGRLAVTPKLDLANDDKNVELCYDRDAGKTNVRLTASASDQTVTVSQEVGDNNRVSPSISSNGDMSLAYERRLSDDSSLTATLKHNDNLNVEWKDADWTANVQMPVEGTSLGTASVNIKRDVSF